MAKSDEFDAEESETSKEKSPKRGRARVVHNIQTTFVEEPRIKDVLNATPAPVTYIEPMIEEEEEGETPLADKVEQYLQTIQQEKADYEVCVYRLPYYSANGKTDTRSGRIYCGRFPFDPDTYEAEIRSRYAKPGLVNIFFSEVRHNGITRSTLPVCHVELELDTENAAPAMSASVAPVVGQTLLPASADSLEQQLGQFERFLGLAQRINKITNPAPAVVAKPALAPEVTEELAILKLLMSSDDAAERIRNSAIGKLFGNAKPEKHSEPSTVEIITLVIQQAPVLIAEGVKLYNQLRAQVAPPSVGQVAQPLAPLPPNPPAVEPMAEYQALFNSLLQGLEQNAPTANAAILIRAFLIQHPDYDAPLMNFLQADTDTLLQTIRQIPNAEHLADLPHAKHWLQSLHNEFFESEDDTNANQPAGTANNAE